MSDYFELYAMLPAIVKIAGQSWGVALPLNLIPLTFIALLSVGFIVVPLRYLTMSSQPMLLRVGMVMGGSLLLAGTVLSFLAEAHLYSTTIILREGLCCMGVVLLGSILVSTVHQAFRESC